MSVTGNKGRFAERIKRIRYNRLIRNKNFADNNEVLYKNILKIAAVIPMVVAENVFYNPKTDKKQKIIFDDKTISSDEEIDYEKYRLKKKVIDLGKINKINISELKKKQNYYNKSFESSVKKDKIVNTKTDDTVITDNVKPKFVGTDTKEAEEKTSDYVKTLEKKIIDLIQKDLLKMVNELEIYESELYILGEINKDEKTLEECKKRIDEIRKLLSKIEKIKRKYDYLKDNYDFEYLLELDNEPLADRIIELKNVIANNEIKATVEDYKLLDLYKYLYVEIDKIHDKTIDIETEKKKQEEELKKRDIDFEELKKKVFNVDNVGRTYENFVKEQNLLIGDLSNKINKIDSREVVDYHMKGFGALVGSTFRYLGLLAISPLRGIFPSIAVSTAIARNAITNLRSKISWEETRKTVYDAINYADIVNASIDDIGYTGRMLDATLEDLVKLKTEYNNKFKQYQGDFSEYKMVINKINEMQANLINNKIKMAIIDQKMRTYKKENEKKLELVRKLNENENKNQ